MCAWGQQRGPLLTQSIRKRTLHSLLHYALHYVRLVLKHPSVYCVGFIQSLQIHRDSRGTRFGFRCKSVTPLVWKAAFVPVDWKVFTPEGSFNSSFNIRRVGTRHHWIGVIGSHDIESTEVKRLFNKETSIVHNNWTLSSNTGSSGVSLWDWSLSIQMIYLFFG